MKRCARSLWRQAQLNPRITAGDFDVLIFSVEEYRTIYSALRSFYKQLFIIEQYRRN